ncbi:MAG: hypothetical protein ACOX7P_08400 [Oscillospiraceae bacterium]|jgi:hypothetical protein
MKKMISLFLCSILVFSLITNVFAADAPSASEGISAADITPESVTKEDLYLTDPITLYTSPEVAYTPKNPTKAGVYPIYSRYRLEQSGSSNGLIERDNQIGNYISIASIALSFSGYAPAMTVATIFSIVGLAVSQNTYSNAKTYTSYVQYTKYGESRWSDETNYTAMVLSGRRNHYKHVLAATKNSSGQWTSDTEDFLDTPCTVESGNYYNNSGSWFIQESATRFVAGEVLYDLPW